MEREKKINEQQEHAVRFISYLAATPKQSSPLLDVKARLVGLTVIEG